MTIVFPACDWCYMFWLWAGETHSLFWSPENELPELNCLLEKPHTGEKPGTKCIQVESNFKNSHQICPDSTLWHTQPTAVKMGHKHSLHYRSDQVLGTTPGLFCSLFSSPLYLWPGYAPAQLDFSSAAHPEKSGGLPILVFFSICTKTALLLHSKSSFVPWAGVVAARTWTWRMKKKTELSCLLEG